jgi:hypothetical protein
MAELKLVRRIVDDRPVFQSPTAQLAAARPKAEPKPRATRGPNATVGYHTDCVL